MTPGNHEFDFGPEVARARIGEAKFPIVTSNVREADGSQPANTADEKIVEIEGVKIGFYGLTTEDTPILATTGDVKFASSVDTGRAKGAALARSGRRFRRRGGAYAARRRHDPGARQRRRPRALRPRRAPAHLLRRQDGADGILQPGGLRGRHRGGDRQDREGRQGQRLLEADLRHRRHDRRRARSRDRRARQELHRQARRRAEGRDRHDGDAARQPPRHGARAGGGDRQPVRRRDAPGGRRRHRHHQWRRHPRRQGISRRHEADARRHPGRASLRQRHGEARTDRRADRGGAGERF